MIRNDLDLPDSCDPELQSLLCATYAKLHDIYQQSGRVPSVQTIASAFSIDNNTCPYLYMMLLQTFGYVRYHINNPQTPMSSLMQIPRYAYHRPEYNEVSATFPTLREVFDECTYETFDPKQPDICQFVEAVYNMAYGEYMWRDTVINFKRVPHLLGLSEYENPREYAYAWYLCTIIQQLHYDITVNMEPITHRRVDPIRW